MQPHAQIRPLIWQCKFLLRAASLLVPRPQRAQWYQEWYGEAWHWLHFLAESGQLNSQTSLELARHCWGAFPDAAWHRFSQKKVVRAFNEVPRTARFCLGAIFSVFVLLKIQQYRKCDRKQRPFSKSGAFRFNLSAQKFH